MKSVQFDPKKGVAHVEFWGNFGVEIFEESLVFPGNCKVVQIDKTRFLLHRPNLVPSFKWPDSAVHLEEGLNVHSKEDVVYTQGDLTVVARTNGNFTFVSLHDLSHAGSGSWKKQREKMNLLCEKVITLDREIQKSRSGDHGAVIIFTGDRYASWKDVGTGSITTTVDVKSIEQAPIGQKSMKGDTTMWTIHGIGEVSHTKGVWKFRLENDAVKSFPNKFCGKHFPKLIHDVDISPGRGDTGVLYGIQLLWALGGMLSVGFVIVGRN